jgi:hypothetical protein
MNFVNAPKRGLGSEKKGLMELLIVKQRIMKFMHSRKIR